MPVDPKILQQIKENNTVLDLSNYELSSEDVREIVAALTALKKKIKLQVLILSNNAIKPDPNAYDVIMDFIIHNTTIIRLELANIVIGDRIALLIANALACNNTIAVVDLTGSIIGLAGSEALSEVQGAKKTFKMVRNESVASSSSMFTPSFTQDQQRSKSTEPVQMQQTVSTLQTFSNPIGHFCFAFRHKH